MHGVTNEGKAIDQMFDKDVNAAIPDEMDVFEIFDRANMTFDQ